jgi:predicted DNA-binding protein
MLKTYLYIPEILEQKIKLTAQNQNKSKAEIIRLALEKGITAVAQQGTASAEVLLKIAELGKQHKLQGPTNSSIQIDNLLWGKDWSKDE